MKLALSAAVVHHPSRAELLPGLLDRLDHPGVRVRVQVDTESNGVWPVARKAWRASHPVASHHLVVQDDVLPCREFLVGAIDALAARPFDVVSFYCARKVQRTAVERGSAWATMGSISSGCAIAMPVDLVDQWLSWCNVWVKPEYPHDDARLSLWALHHARRVWYTCPSLVEHIGTESLAGHPRTTGGRERKAAVYIGSERSPRGIPWARQEAVPHDSGVSLKAYEREGWKRG